MSGSVKYIPWCDHISEESIDIHNELLLLNKKGYLTINSQPRMNGVPSESENGWGGSGGYLYQKAYIEFFSSKDDLNKLLDNDKIEQFSYCAVNVKGNVITNCENCTNAVTWGVFPNKQIIQPTVVDYESFLIWKEDAFRLWISEWANIYDDDSISHKLIKEIHDTYYLVFIVDNDYINGNLFSML